MCIGLFSFLHHCIKQNRFQVAVGLFSNRSQKTSKCGKNISDMHSPAVRVPLLCFYHILTSSVICYWKDARQHGICLLNQKQRWHNNLIVNNNTIDINIILLPIISTKRHIYTCNEHLSWFFSTVHLWCFDSKTLFTLTQSPILYR